MVRGVARLVLSLIVVLSTGSVLPATAQDDCEFAGEVLIGVLAPLTGSLYKVGQSTQSAAEMAVDEINADCGLQIGGQNYEVIALIENNESEPEASVEAATRLIMEQGVIAIIGPQASVQAVPTGEVVNELETPMISPWNSGWYPARSRHAATSARP